MRTPPKETVLLPWVLPKPTPVMVTLAPTGAEVGKMLVMVGGAITVKEAPRLVWPPTVTTTLPVVAPAGTMTVMPVADQLEAVAARIPLKLTVLDPCGEPKFVPLMTTTDPAAAEAGNRLVMTGRGGLTVNVAGALVPFTVVTVTFAGPVAALVAMVKGTVIWVALTVGLPTEIPELLVETGAPVRKFAPISVTEMVEPWTPLASATYPYYSFAPALARRSVILL